MKRNVILIVITILFSLSIFSVFSKPNPNVTSTSNYKKSLIEADQFGNTSMATPEMVQARLKNISASFDLKYDATVQSYIDRYLKNGRRQLSEILALSAYYMPIFESALKEAGLPDEFKYIPIIESNLKTRVTSNRGAGGLWQFMPATAKGYDMKITSAIDERCDPYLASEKACDLLKKQYDKFGDWTLALAAYNAGGGTVQRAMKRAGAKKGEADFWTIYNYLPSQTRHYVPKLIAMIYLMNYHAHHNISKCENTKVTYTDTLRVTEKVSLSKVAKELELDLAHLRNLNPHLRADYAPGTATHPCTLILPADHISAYRDRRDQLTLN